MELDSIQKTASGKQWIRRQKVGAEGKGLVWPQEDGNTKDKIKGGKRGE